MPYLRDMSAAQLKQWLKDHGWKAANVDDPQLRWDTLEEKTASLNALHGVVDKDFRERIRNRTRRWLPVYLKLEEAQFFLDQLGAHQRYPKLLLFYLSAFVSAARSITMHIENQIVPAVPDARTAYDINIATFLANKTGALFVSLRNEAVHQAYPILRCHLKKASALPDGKEVWIDMEMRRVEAPTGIAEVDELFRIVREKETRWQVYWTVGDMVPAPELIPTCQLYFSNLCNFVDSMVASLEDQSPPSTPP